MFVRGCLLLGVFLLGSGNDFAQAKPWQEQSLRRAVLLGGGYAWNNNDLNTRNLVKLWHLRAAHAWRWRSDVELQLSTSFHLAKSRQKYYPFFSTGEESDKTFGLSAGLSLRWNIVDTEGFRMFFDFSSDILQTSDRVPIGGTHRNWLGRFGPGFNFPYDRRHSIEFRLYLAHLSNGHGLLDDRDSWYAYSHNPGWDGAGITLAWRREIYPFK